MILPSIIRAWSLPRPRLSLALLALALTGGYALLAARLPPADDELYYWCWARSLQWSYYDHPVMTALFIRAGQELFGTGLLALRLPACVTTALVFAMILHLTRPRAVAWWLLATPLFSLGACLITPDTPLLLFWAAYLLWLVRTHERLATNPATSSGGTFSPGFPNWLIGGVLLGCGVLGKYTMALAIPAGALTFLFAHPLRRWLVGYITHGVVAFMVALPILIFNFQQDFAPLKYQWWHSMGQSRPNLVKFGEFIGIQMLLFGTMPVVLLPWVLANARSLWASPRLRVCLCLYGFPFLFFLYKATRGHLEGNWALASYIAFWPLAAEWYERHRATRFGYWAMRLSFMPPILAVLLLLTHLIYPLPFIPPMLDRVTRQTEKMTLAARMADDWRQKPLPLYAETYQWVALLRFHGIDARQVAGASRASHFTQVPQTPRDDPDAYILWENVPQPSIIQGTGAPVLVREYPLVVRNTEVTRFYLWKVKR